MLLLRIERYLRARKMVPTRFGRNAIGDPWLVRDMRDGRTLQDRTVLRVNAYLDCAEAELRANMKAASDGSARPC